MCDVSVHFHAHIYGYMILNAFLKLRGNTSIRVGRLDYLPASQCLPKYSNAQVSSKPTHKPNGWSHPIVPLPCLPEPDLSPLLLSDCLHLFFCPPPPSCRLSVKTQGPKRQMLNKNFAQVRYLSKSKLQILYGTICLVKFKMIILK